jgi:DNA repair protein RadA/Sms
MRADANPENQAATSTEIDLTDDRDDVVKISQMSAADYARRSTLIEPLDRVLGGGLVVGGSVMVSGGPGAGKTTLLFQMIASVRRPDGSPCEVVLWASAEEPQAHIRLRAERIGIAGCGVETYAQKRDVDRIIAHARKMKAEVLVVDSIQTIVTRDIDSLAGSPQQCGECARRLDRFGKETGCSVVIICQITKDGRSAGPKTLEHLVDATFSIETCEEFKNIRYLRAEKNRFGSVTEVGMFEMTESGMKPLPDQDQAAMKDRDGGGDAMLPIAQELLQRFLEMGGEIDAGLRNRIAGRLDLTPRGSP